MSSDEMRRYRVTMAVASAALLLAACPADVDVALASGPQRAEDVRFVLTGATATVNSFEMRDVTPGSTMEVVWEVAIGSHPRDVKSVTYGVPPPAFRVLIEPKPLLAGRTYCGYMKSWAQACFRVEPDGSVTAAPTPK
jgi:hypothetical protein